MNDLDKAIKTCEDNAELNIIAEGMKEQEPCDDAISRKAIKQRLQDHRDFFINAYGENINRVHENDKARVDEIDNCIAEVINMPSVQPSRKGHWIDVKEQMPEPLQSVIVTWKNHEPEPYYSDIKHKPFVGVAIYYKDKWWWWSAYTEDMLAEYGRSNDDEVDDAIEITAWMPLPDPYMADMRGDTE